uniref:Carboxylic ester hydrolase n=1 Tax=Panagrolaimus sp. ES5 TaxID=591445 RepID=A0AC34FB27_9BILA
MNIIKGQVIVQTPYGDICGKSVTVLDGTKGEAFLGIPYAQPPLDYLKFEPSPDPRGYPVMFFIHGGGFYQGSSFFYHYSGPLSTIIPCGIIFVSINYRLGPWGWLTMGDSRYPGNMGLWDQIEALKFHKQIIGSFGGDPERITIFGESAGGVSVSWLTLTPHTDGLFSKAISMSGSSMAIWGHNEGVIESSRILLSAMGCPLSGDEAVECMKSKSKSDILNALKPIMPTVVKRDDLNIVYWGPRIGGAGDILPGGSIQEAILRAPKRPQMIGMPTVVKRDDLNIVYWGPRIGGAGDILPGGSIQEAILRAPKRPQMIGVNTMEMLTFDVDFTIPAIREAKLKSLAGWPQINMYRYSYANPFLQIIFDPRIKGAAHAMELFNIFDYSMQFLKPFPHQDANIVQHNFINIFMDFVQDRAALPRVSPTTAPFVDINLINSIHRDMEPQILQFWDSLGNEFGFDWPSGDYVF